MPKLHLKHTLQEEAPHRRRQKRKGDGHSVHGINIGSAYTSTWKRRTHSTTGETSRQWASSDEEVEVGRDSDTKPSRHQAHPTSSHDAEEEQRFREKMFDALQDDEHLDSLEARLNAFVHIPERWKLDRGPKSTEYSDEYNRPQDPQDMDEEEYIEWIRLGMYRFACVIYPPKRHTLIRGWPLGGHTRRTTQSMNEKEF